MVLSLDVLFSMRNGGWFGLFAGIITLIALIIAGWWSKPSLEEVGLPDLPVQPPDPPLSGSAIG
ncbi:MAG: hypothetical protein Q7U74_01390 [Saprospiraceae bacterium]|nr:hypothetical protein [Saprospiraceae bacterium]